MTTRLLSLEQLSKEYIVEQDWLFEKFLGKLGSLENLCLTADQGWGIMDYMKELGFQLREKNPDIHICYIDLKPVNSVESFLQHYTAILTQRFPEASSRIKIDNTNLDALKLPDLIAKKKKIKIVVFLANSHLFHRFKDPEYFLIYLWRRLMIQKNCAFCFYGNNTPYYRAQVFHPGPLARFGRAYELKYDPFKYRSTFIRKTFHSQGKNIGFRTSVQMSILVDNHPFYIKILVWHALIRTQNTCTIAIVETALNDMILHYDFRFHKIVEYLTPMQLRFLKAMVEGNQNLSSSETREKYQLETSSHVAKIKKSLQKKEILNAGNRKCKIADPVFELWLQKLYFQ